MCAAEGDWKKIEKITEAVIKVDDSSEIKLSDEPNLHVDIDGKPQTMTFHVGGHTKWQCNLDGGEVRKAEIDVEYESDWKATYPNGEPVDGSIGKMNASGSDKKIAKFQPGPKPYNNIHIECKVTAQPGPDGAADPDGPETKVIKWQPHCIKTWVAKLSGQLGRTTSNSSDKPIVHMETEALISFGDEIDVGPFKISRGNDMKSEKTEKDTTIREPVKGDVTIPDKSAATFLVAAVTYDGNSDIFVGKFTGKITHVPVTRILSVGEIGGYVRVDNSFFF